MEGGNSGAVVVCGVRQDFKANGYCAQSVGSGASQSTPGRTAPVVFEQMAHAVHAWQDVEGEGARLRVEGHVEADHSTGGRHGKVG
jgi:hypothetical protein